MSQSMNLRRVAASMSAVVFVAGLIGISAVQPAIAESVWSGPQDLSAAGQNAFESKVAVSSDGTKAIAVWSRGFIVQAATATISGGTPSWSEPQSLSVAGASAYFSEVALSADGSKATVVWQRDEGPWRIQSVSATISDNTASWSVPQYVSVVGGYALYPQVALSADGLTAMAVWHQHNGSNTIVKAATAAVDGNSASWSTPQDLSQIGQNAFEMQVAMSHDGTKATAVWQRWNGSNNIVQSSSATLSENVASWSSVQDLSVSGRSATVPQIALASTGARATVVWQRHNGTAPVIQSVSATISGSVASWSAPQDLSVGGQYALRAQLALSEDGDKATSVWLLLNGSNYLVQTASASISGNAASWSAAQNLSLAGQSAEFPQVALSASGGKAIAIWRRYNGSNDIVQSTSASISGSTASWSIPDDLSAVGGSAGDQQVALSSDGGRATVVWKRNNGSNDIVQSTSANWLPVNSVLPAIVGEAIVGQTLTASTGTWSSTSTYAFAWQRCNSGGSSCSTSGGSSNTYQLGIGDLGSTVRVIVTGSNSVGSTPATSNVSSVVTGVVASPVNTVRPTITGAANVGVTLTASTGTWNNTPVSYAYQWRRCNSGGTSCRSIKGATLATYLILGADAGATVSVTVTATNASGSAVATSNPTVVVTSAVSAPTIVDPPSISGLESVGQTLTATNGNWSGTPTGYAHQWMRCDNKGAKCNPISGAILTAYTLTINDAGRTLRVRVTAVNASGSTQATSTQTGVILR